MKKAKLAAALGGSMILGGIAGAVIVLLAIGGFFWFLTAPTSEADRAAEDAAEEMEAWTAADLDNLWHEALKLWESAEKTDWPTKVNHKPDLLIDYDVYVSENGVSAMRGGSSFGISGAVVECVFVRRSVMPDGTPVLLVAEEGITCSAPGVWGHYVPGSGDWELEGSTGPPRR